MSTQQDALIQALQGRQSTGGIVEVSKVGKPDQLRGTKEQIHTDWTNWHFTFTTWFFSQFAKAEPIMDWAKDHPEAITRE
eukprot:6088408-Amphidinium_carterae.1